MKKSILLLQLLLGSALFAQTEAKSINSQTLLKEGYELHDNKSYEEAIEKYRQVPENDTNYRSAIYEISLSHLELDNYDSTIYYVDKLKENDEVLLPESYNTKATAYDKKEDFEKAIEVYSEGIKLYPMNYNLYFNRGVTYFKMEESEHAANDFMSAINRNPNHATSHYFLGLLCLDHGMYSQGNLAILTSLYLHPTSNFARSAIAQLENFAVGNSKKTKESTLGFKDAEFFEPINLIYENGAALSKKYKVKLTVKANYGKQIHLILNSLKDFDGEEGFFVENYMPFLSQIFAEGKYDPLISYSLLAVDNDKIQSKLNKKKASLVNFRDYSVKKWLRLISYRTMMYEGEEQDVYAYYSNSSLQLIGLLNEDEEPEGKFEYYSTTGYKTREGSFVKGEKTGSWTSFGNVKGEISETNKFVSDKLDGETLWIDESTGKVTGRLNFKDGQRDGICYTYYLSGDVKEITPYKNGEYDGEYKKFSPAGDLALVVPYKDGIVNGDVKSYHDNGAIYKELPYVNGKIEGLAKFYYPDGNIEKQANYEDDYYNGDFKSYFSNGQLEEDSQYKEGRLIGEVKYYHMNGNLSSTCVLDENGKQNGIVEFYSYDGKKYSQKDYRKGEIVEYQFTNEKGEVLVDKKRKGKKLEFESYNDLGYMIQKGLYLNNKKEGDWKFYDVLGNLVEELNYKEGKFDGDMKNFHSNGTVSKVAKFKNGEYDGLYTTFNQKSKKVFEGNYLDGGATGTLINFFADGTRNSVRFYLGDKQHGKQYYYNHNQKIDKIVYYDMDEYLKTDYFDNEGNIVCTFTEGDEVYNCAGYIKGYTPQVNNFKNGEKHGKSTTYAPNGNKVYECDYVNGVREGKLRRWNEEGVLTYEVNYVNNKKEGVEKDYYYDGTLESEGTFVNGELHGEYKTYSENGKLSFKVNYENGNREGKAYRYNLDGDLTYIRMHRHNSVTGYTYLDAAGKELPVTEFKNGTGVIDAKFPNGKQSAYIEYKAGERSGKFETYYKSGKVYESFNYINGEKDGEAIEYLSNGKFLKVINYYLGEYNGRSKTYNLKGVLIKDFNYVFGNLNGELKYYNDNGVLKETRTYYYGDLLSAKNN